MTAGEPHESDDSQLDASPVSEGPRHLFRGDDGYRGGSIGLAIGPDADAADIQGFADHVLRKSDGVSSRFTSFTTEVSVARKFTSADDSRFVCRVSRDSLRELASAGEVIVWWPDDVYLVMKAGRKRDARQAADVRAAMLRNAEVLIEGQIPADSLRSAN